MEGSDNNILKAYDYLAYYYDYLLMDDESLSYWLKYIHEEPFNTCLELASGTGVLASILKREGYDIIASDISSSMKEASKVNFDGEYLLLDMSNFNLDKQFDLILCLCDSFNYLSDEGVKSFISCCQKHLKEGGRLIFDMHHLSRLKEFSQEYIEEGYIDDVGYQWTINAYENTLNEHFTFYTDKGMIKEDHVQEVFNPSKIIEELNKYFDVNYIEDFIPDEKVLFIAKKRSS